MGVQSSESVWSTVRPGPNGTIVTEIHHQSGDSPPEVVYFINGIQVKPEGVLGLLQELAEIDEKNKGKDPKKPDGEKPTSEKEGRAIEIESMDEVDGKNLRNLIRVLEEIQRRIELFRKDVAEILHPIVLNFNPVLEARPPPNSSKPQTESESKPETAPPKAQEKPEKPSNTEETPTKNDEKPTKTEEKPTKTKDKLEEKPTKTEEKPIKTDVKPEEKPTKTEEKPEEKSTKTR
ncbi:hypothetical protein WDU94_003258 [Cyamophila willieti]